MVDENSMGSMIEYSEDISTAEAPIPLPEGDYPAEIIGAELGTSNNTGRPRVAITFSIKPEDYPVDYEDADSYPDGKNVMYFIGASDDKASRYRMRQFCEKIGVPMGTSLDLNEWTGRNAVLKIVHQEYNGQDQENVRTVEAT